MSGILNSCRKVKYIWSTHIHEAIRTKMLFGNDNFVFKYPVKCKKSFSFSIFLLNFRKPFDFYALNTLILSIVFHTQGPNTQDNVNYVLDFCV